MKIIKEFLEYCKVSQISINKELCDLNKMTDEEFESYLILKYGFRWKSASLTEDEINRLPRNNF